MSKPKQIRSCACCGIKLEKSILLRINLPFLEFDFFQSNNFRSFYVCQNIKCIKKVLKKHAVSKYVNLQYENIETMLLNIIKNKLSIIVSDLFEKNSIDIKDMDNSTCLFLSKQKSELKEKNILFIGDIFYCGSKALCVVKNKTIATKILNYKNIITYIDGFNGELNGSKKG